MEKLLTGKTALITGSGRGIGRAILKAFSEEGATVIATDISFPDDFHITEQEITEKGGKVIRKIINVTHYENVQKAVDEIITETNKIDILINNAGITKDKLVMRMSEEDWDTVLSVNLKGAFNLTKAVFKYMAKQRYGKIVNLSSVSGIMGNAGQSNYSASKAGLIGLTKSTAKEFASRNINVNAVAPGFVQTEMTDALTEEQKKSFLDIIPLKRPCNPSEIADLVVFLSSDKAGYITGQVITIDGGMLM